MKFLRNADDTLQVQVYMNVKMHIYSRYKLMGFSTNAIPKKKKSNV